MKRLLLLLFLLTTLSTVTVSCASINQVTDTVQETLAEIRDEPEPAELTQRQQTAAQNRPFWLASLALVGIAFCAIAAMVLSNRYV